VRTTLVTARICETDERSYMNNINNSDKKYVTTFGNSFNPALHHKRKLAVSGAP